MSALLLRKLTEKSTLKFGKYKDYTVEHLFGMKLEKNLISIYFKLSNITFMDNILDRLGITEEWRIEKPSKDVEMFYDFMFQKYGEKLKPNKKLQRMKKETLPYKKGFLQTLNHGYR